ncbi:MAG: hypothetical protein AAF196_15705 [Planctomycetota bacterium]
MNSSKQIQALLLSSLLPALAQGQEPSGQEPSSQQPSAQKPAEQPSRLGRGRSEWPPFDRRAYTERLLALGLSENGLETWQAITEPEQLARESDLLVRRLVPELGEAASGAESGDPRALVALITLVQDEERPVVRAHATYHAARTVLESGDAVRAIDLFATFLREEPGRTPLDADATFHYALANSKAGFDDVAVRAFQIFLERFPEAPEAFRDEAARLRAELAAGGGSPLREIVDEMNSVGQQISQGSLGEETQLRQQAITESLERILEELEEEDQQRNDSAQNTQTSTSPASQSRLPGGRSEVGTLAAPSSVADRWGDVRDREREEILNEIQTRFRGRYRELLEGYYRRLSETEDR